MLLYFDIKNACNFKNAGQDYIVRKKELDGSYKTINNGSGYVLKSIADKL